MATIKGQNLRVLQGIDADSLKCVAASTSCAVHVSMQLEENTNKDVDSDWITQEPTSLAWDVQVDALVLGEDPTDTGATPITELVVGRTYVLKFSRTLGAAGEKNRDAVADEIAQNLEALVGTTEEVAPKAEGEEGEDAHKKSRRRNHRRYRKPKSGGEGQNNG